METPANLSQTAEKVLELARKEARDTGRKAVGTEHILVGLLEERRSLAHLLLEHFGVNTERVRGLIGTIYPESEPNKIDNLEFTPRTKSVLSLSAQHAKDRASAQIEPEHILLALLQEDAGLASKVLERLQVDTTRIESCIPGGSASVYFATHEDFKKALNITNAVRSDVLLRNRGIVGKTRGELKDRLGEPDKESPRIMEYLSKTAGDRSGSTRLVIMMENNTAVQYNLIRES